MKKPLSTPLRRFPRYFEILLSQSLMNRDYIYYWILSSIIAVAMVNATHWISWILFTFVMLLFGLAGIASCVYPVDKALETIGLDYSTGYGTPKWLIDCKYPKKQDIIRISSAGYDAPDFEKFSNHLASRLRSPIKAIRKPSPSVPIIEIVLKRSSTPKVLPFSSLPLGELNQGEFFVGKSEDELVRLNLSKMIHMLVAGQTGSGKTQYLRQLIATLLTCTRQSHVCLIDMKGGVDFQSFIGVQNFELVTTHDSASVLLADVVKLFEKRRDYLLKKKKTNWAELSQKALLEDSDLKGLPIGPLVVVVDELAELSKKATQASAKSDLQNQLATIARLARFTGIHLILGTQRPDKSTIDMQSKDNLPTRVCFSVPSVTASNLVLGDMSASSLGNHPGRAVFQFQGNKVVQTPLIEDSTIESQMTSLKEKLTQSKYARVVLAENKAVGTSTAPVGVVHVNQ